MGKASPKVDITTAIGARAMLVGVELNPVPLAKLNTFPLFR
jgi:hypothetical protein